LKIRLFPREFLLDDGCFGLFKLDARGESDLPVSIEGDCGIPFHIVHSDPDHLAYLAGLIVLQAWTYGIDEPGIPPFERRPLLVITDSPGRFGESYLRLNLPPERIKQVSNRRRVTLYLRTGEVPNVSRDKSGYWDVYIQADESRIRLHNFFPACYILGADREPRLIASRQHLGQGDYARPALLITRRADRDTIHELISRYTPLLVFVHTPGVAVPSTSGDAPTVIYHESIFSPVLVRGEPEKIVLCCLPDARFERFCSQARLCFVEPGEAENVRRLWADVDGALQALIERVDQRRDRVVVEVHRAASRLRNLLLSLPVGIQSYEKALLASGLPPALWHGWSASELLHALESRIPEMAALGEWEDLILRELVDGFRRLEDLLQHDSPKREPLLSAVKESLSQSRRVVLLVSSPSLATGLKWVARLPEPLGLGLPPDDVTVRTPEDIQALGPDEDCVIHQVFDPHNIFSLLARSGTKQITFVLLRNELRFVGERFLRSRRLLPDHPANRNLLRPIFEQVERLEPASRVTRRDRTSTLFSDYEFEMVMRMFEQGARDLDHGTVLVDQPDQGAGDATAEVPAYLVRLEGESAVFLEVGSRVSYLRDKETIVTGEVDSLEPGDRLIIVSPGARESIAHRILSARRGEEMDQAAGVGIKKWQEELAEGIRRLEVPYSEVLRRIQELGSQRISPVVIGQWARGNVLGPLDAHDIRRIGQVVGSGWIVENWQRIGWALVVVRSGHRLLGRQITGIIQRAAVGDYRLARQDEEFLEQIGITMGELQDAVTLIKIEAVSHDSRVVPIEQIGKVVPV
jgi:hypothetical protein